jgi:hypothetical protein
MNRIKPSHTDRAPYLYDDQTSLIYGTILAWIGSTAIVASLAEMASMLVVIK